MTFKAQKFSYQHPLFGRSNKGKAAEKYKNTVYYYWWEFLRRNAEYERCCKKYGVGKFSALYDDFGDVFAGNFKTWWQADKRGARLFAEELPPEFKVMSVNDPPIDDPQVVYIQVPLSLPKRYLRNQFLSVIGDRHLGRAGRRNNAVSTARYPVSGHVDIDALDKCLRVYDMKANNPNMKLWEVAQECKVAKIKQFVKNDGSESPQVISNKKLVLANTARRLLNRAEKMIENVGRGKFPLSK